MDTNNTSGTPPEQSNKPDSSAGLSASPQTSPSQPSSPQVSTPPGTGTPPGTSTPTAQPDQTTQQPQKAEQHKRGIVPVPLIIALLIFSFLGGLLLAGWYFQMQLQKISAKKAQASQPAAVAVQPKKIIIGTDATFQPMEYKDVQGQLAGYDIDLGNKIGSELGAQVDFENIPWDNLFKALEDKKIDMIISGVTITDERKKTYDFSDQYLNVGQVIITQKNNTTINSAATLQGKKIGVQQGTTLEQAAVKYTPDSLVIRYPDYVQATKALADGKVDAILSDLPSAKGVITANPGLKIASDPLTNEYYGIVFRKGDPAVKSVDDVLSSLRIKGILTDLKQKWLD